jgi:AcrR family transcriptional regulator
MELTQKGIDTRTRIVETAITLFAKKGFAATGLRELANEADVNLAMINYFFGSKKGLLKDILATFFDGYSSLMQQHLRGQDEPKEKLRRFIREAVDYFHEHRNALLIVLTELPHEDPEITQFKAKWATKMMIIVREEICTPLEETSGVVVSPVVIGPLLVSMMSSRFLFAPIIETVNPPGLKEEFLDKYSDLVTEIFLEGLGGLAAGKDGG